MTTASLIFSAPAVLQFYNKMSDMIKLAFENDFRQLNYLSVKDIRNKISTMHYPQLQLRLKLITEALEQEFRENAAAEKAILLKIGQELNSMINKEEQLLFPLLQVLEKEQRKSDCEPFKLAKKHYQSLLSGIQNLRCLLQADHIPFSTMEDILEQINGLEDNVVQLQKAKEKYLFNKYKNCNQSCKVVSDEQSK